MAKHTATAEATTGVDIGGGMVVQMTAAQRQAYEMDLATKRGAAGTVTFKIGPSGGVSVYGLGRRPTTLYREQWLRLLEKEGEMRAFFQANKAALDATLAAFIAKKGSAKAQSTVEAKPTATAEQIAEAKRLLGIS